LGFSLWRAAPPPPPPLSQPHADKTVLTAAEKEALSGKGGTVSFEGTDYDLTPPMCLFDKKTVKQSVIKYTPSVIEPSFGIDRLLSGILEHAYYERGADEGDSKDDGKITRGVLALSALVAPYKCCILPLDKRIKEHESYKAQKTDLRDELSRKGISYHLGEHHDHHRNSGLIEIDLRV
jgi:glycyl-tRNA synthetase